MTPFDPELLARFFQDQCTPEEYRQVLEWLNTAAGQQYLSAAMQEDLEKPADGPQTSRSAEIYHRILHTVQQLEAEQPQQRRPGLLRRIRPLKAAAVLAGAALLCFGAWKTYQRAGTVTWQTAYGEIRTITLPDQSVVTLNGNSTLRYSRRWDRADDREIWVQGEAFFDVKPAAQQRFLVHTSHRINVEVLGTTFNVLDRGERVQVVLRSGKVRLSGQTPAIQQPIVMQPGELVEIRKSAPVYHRKQIDAEQYASWKNRKLQFSNTSFAEVVRILQETYGLTVIVKDTSLLHQQLSGTVPSGNANMLLDGLSQLLGLKITRQDATVNIESNRQ